MVSICTAKVCTTKNSAFAPHGVIKWSTNLAKKKKNNYFPIQHLQNLSLWWCVVFPERYELKITLSLQQTRLCYFNACTVHLLLFLFQPTNAQTCITYNTIYICGPGTSVGIATDGWTVRDRIPVGTRFSARPDRPWGPPSLL